jgi:hypothetical protein
METLLALIIGTGLSAACGFRVFVPLLAISIAGMSGHVHLAAGFGWIGTWPALIAFASATVMEVGAYCLPWVDNALDLIATPAAIVAGVIMTASLIGDVSPFMRWSLAAIAGGGVAGMVQMGTTAVRGASSAMTGGLGNFFVSAVELIGAVLMAIVAILFPVVCVIVVVALCLFMIRKLMATSGANQTA